MSDHCPAFDECRYGGAGTDPICATYCGNQHGGIWREISDMDLGWPEKNALFEQRQRDELIPLSTYREDTHMTAIPTPADFLMSRSEADEEYDELSDTDWLFVLTDRLERRIVDLEKRVGLTDQVAAEPVDSEGTVCTTCVDLQEQAQLLREELADEQAKHAVVIALVDQIEGIVKKSTSKVSLDVKAAIEAWKNPQTPSPAPDVAESAVDDAAGAGSPEQDVQQGAGEGLPEAPEGHVSKAERAQMMGGFVGQPTRDADVAAWRSYARAQGYTGPDVDQMNRSQIRTMLGIEQPVPDAS